MKPLELAKNSYVIALAGEEGADKLARVVVKYKNQPLLWALTSVTEPQTKVSTLYSFWDFGRRLGVDGLSHGGSRNGRAFGVLNNAGGASRAEK